MDNDGNALTVGDQYFNTSANELRVYNGSTWQAASTVGGTVTSLSVTGATTLGQNPTLSAGTANGVAYLNGSKVLTTGSALTFDGSALNVSGGIVTAGSASFSGNITPASGSSIELTYLSSTGFITSYNRTSSAWTDLNIRSLNTIFNVGGSEGMRLTSTGLGIGTSSPVYKLTTNVTGGSATALFKTDQATADIYLQASGTSQTYSVGIGASGNALRFMSGTLGTTALLDSSGNLGIGTSSPSVKLDVYGSGAYLGQFIRSTSGVSGGGISVGNQSRVFTMFTDSAGWSLYDNTAGAQRMLMSADGNLGLGVTPSAWVSNWRALDVGAGASIYSNGANNAALAANAYNIDGGGGWRYKGTGNANLFQTSGGQFLWYNAPSGTAGNAISFTQAMTLDASGNLGVGTTSPNNYAGYGNITLNGSSGGIFDMSVGNTRTGSLYATSSLVVLSARTAIPLVFETNALERARIDSSGNLLVGTTTLTSIGSGYNSFNVAGTNGAGAVFKNTAGSQISYVWCDALNRLYCVQNTGGVYLTSGATSWTANSDERQKDIIESITDAANKVATLRAVIGKYKTDDEGVRRAFLIAQDVQAVLPEAVDASDPEKLGVQYTDTIPLLVAAIQEQQAIINQLKADVAALKGA